MHEVRYKIWRARHTICKRAEDKSVRTQPACEKVCATPSNERVVAGEAHEHICRRRPGQSIVEGRTREVLERRQRVRPGAARVLGSRSRQADRYRSSRVFVRHGVGARSTIKNVVGAIAFERVVEARTCQILNTDQRVALGIAATRRSRRQAHRHP